MRYSLYMIIVPRRFYTHQHAEHLVSEWSATPAAQFLIQRDANIWWRTLKVNNGTGVRIQVLGELEPSVHTMYLLKK